MNPIFIVMTILFVLMFDLGLTLKTEDFKRVFQYPKALVVAMTGQLILLPALAFALGLLFRLPPLFFIGLVLIGCCPGGSSSNIFSKLAGGDVALSVSLTAFSSLVTLVTIPFVLSLAASVTGSQGVEIHLPVGKLLIQNLVLMLLPILLGFVMARKLPAAAVSAERILSKCAFPALMLIVTIFFIQHYHTIADNLAAAGLSVAGLLVAATVLSSCLSRLVRLSVAQRRTVTIEVGMQNAAQAIAIASSPFIFNSAEMAIPPIIYSLLMNLLLLPYVAVIRHKDDSIPTMRN